MVDMPISGYGAPLDASYARHSDYATYTNNPAFANLSEVKEGQWGPYVDYNVVVPQGGFVLEVYSANATALIEAISGITYAENNVNTSSINVDNVRVSYDASTGVVTVSEPK